MEELLKRIYADLIVMSVNYVPKIFLAIATYLIGTYIITYVHDYFRNKLNRAKTDPTLSHFLLDIINVLARVMILISVASVLGLQTTSFIAILSAAGLAVGLALQGSLSNFAGGVLILLLRPFRVGHVIRAQGQTGTVREIQVLVTKLFTGDEEEIIIPNGVLANGIIENLSNMFYKRLQLNFVISADNDLQNVRKILLDLAANDARSYHKEFNEETGHKGDKPSVVFTLNEFTVNVSFRMWVAPMYYAALLGDMSEKVHAKLGKEINAPRPARDIFVHEKKY